MKQKIITESVMKLSKGTLTALSDALLYSFFLFGSSIGKSATSRGVSQSFQEADEAFRKFNSKTIINALSRLKYKYKYINISKDKSMQTMKITSLGRRRLLEIIPHYKVLRPWDEKLYLVSFDIPERKRELRHLFRIQLKKLGAGLLQNSLWLSPYNPIQVLKPIINKFSMDEWVIITPISKHAIMPYGERGLPSLLEKIYQLSDLDKRYKDYIVKSSKDERLSSTFEYINLIKDDPQLPFVLEPKGFHARQAYLIYKRINKL